MGGEKNRAIKRITFLCFIGETSAATSADISFSITFCGETTGSASSTASFSFGVLSLPGDGFCSPFDAAVLDRDGMLGREQLADPVSELKKPDWY